MSVPIKNILKRGRSCCQKPSDPPSPSFPTHLHHNVILLSYISTHQQYTKTWTELKLVGYASVFQNTVLDILKSNLTIHHKKIYLSHNWFPFFFAICEILISSHLSLLLSAAVPRLYFTPPPPSSVAITTSFTCSFPLLRLKQFEWRRFKLKLEFSASCTAT